MINQNKFVFSLSVTLLLTLLSSTVPTLAKEEPAAVTTSAKVLRSAKLPEDSGINKREAPIPDAWRHPNIRSHGNQRWIERYVNTEINLGDAENKHGIYIRNCRNTTVNIGNTQSRGFLELAKVAHVELENCHNVTVRVASVITSIELYHCNGVKINCPENLSTLQVDNSQGCIFYLSNQETSPVNIFHSLSKNLQLFDVNQGTSVRFDIQDSLPRVILQSGKVSATSNSNRQLLTRIENGVMTTLDTDSLIDKQGYLILPENNFEARKVDPK